MANIFAGIKAGAEAGRAKTVAREKLKLDQANKDRTEGRLVSDSNLKHWESASKFQDGIWDLTQGDGPVNIDEISGKLKMGSMAYGSSWYIDGADLLMDLHATPKEVQNFIGSGASEADKNRLKQYSDWYSGNSDGGLPPGIKPVNTRNRSKSGGKKYYRQTKDTGSGRGTLYLSEAEVDDMRTPQSPGRDEIKSLHGFMDQPARQKNQLVWEENKVKLLDAKQAQIDDGATGSEWTSNLAKEVVKNSEAFRSNPTGMVDWLTSARAVGVDSGLSPEFVNKSLEPYYEQAEDIYARNKATVKGKADDKAEELRWKKSIELTSKAVDNAIAIHVGAKHVELGFESQLISSFNDEQMSNYRNYTTEARDLILVGLSQPEVMKRILGQGKIKYPAVTHNNSEVSSDRVSDLVGEIAAIAGYVYHDGKLIDPTSLEEYDAGVLVKKYLTELDKAK